MKWFIKALKQYADFSGRARRKEYWYFILFNIIFAIVWTLLMTIVFALIQSSDGDRVIIAQMVAAMSYGIAMLLPSLAVGVRRLHDTGRSAWWLLIGLVPFIGGIWLFVLMVLDSQPDANRYGPNPKTSPHDTLGEEAALKTAGHVFIVAACAALLLMGLLAWMRNMHMDMPITVFLAMTWMKFAFTALFLAGGVFLVRAKANLALMLFLIAGGAGFVLDLAGGIQIMSSMERSPVERLLVVEFTLRNALSLTLVLFAASALFCKALVRKAAVALIVVAGAALLCGVFAAMVKSGLHIPLWQQVMFMFGVLNVLHPIALMLLAYTRLGEKK